MGVSFLLIFASRLEMPTNHLLATPLERPSCADEVAPDTHHANSSGSCDRHTHADFRPQRSLLASPINAALPLDRGLLHLIPSILRSLELKCVLSPKIGGTALLVKLLVPL